MKTNTARTIPPEFGSKDFGPFSVEIEHRGGCNFVHDFSDDPATAQFPYAYDRASRCFNEARRDPTVSWAVVSGPLGTLDSRNL